MSIFSELIYEHEVLNILKLCMAEASLKLLVDILSDI